MNIFIFYVPETYFDKGRNDAIINGEYNYLSNTTLLNNIKNILINVLNYKAIILFIVIYFIMKKTKKTPVIYILLGGLIGAFIF